MALASLVIHTSLTDNLVRKRLAEKGLLSMCQWKRIVLRVLVSLSESTLSNCIVPGTVLRHLSSQQSYRVGTMVNLYFTNEESEAQR